MNEVEFEVYRSTQKANRHIIYASEIGDVPEHGIRILLHGYTAPREDFFVGIRRNPQSRKPEIGRAVGTPSNGFGLVWEQWQHSWPSYLLDPKKRIYGERTDLTFMLLLRDRTEHVASVVAPDPDWPGWDRDRLPKTFVNTRPWAPEPAEYAEGTKIR